ncbi:MAG: Flp pilus assembly complex ATPase component TadA [Candidatus Omnitrophica bacterium]|nr:Flp pilus assembly complex ATPase component TadA [Candidatus Omnitrophota bacterium]
MISKRIEELLLKKKWLSDEQLQEAQREQRASKVPLGTILVQKGLISPEQLAQALAEQYKMPFVSLREMEISREAVDQVPVKVALHFKIVPVRLENGVLTVAISNPQDVRLLDDLRVALQGRFSINPVLATEEEIGQALKRNYGVGAETVDQILAGQRPGAAETAGDEAIENIQELAGDASVIKLVNQLILEAHARRATDIHLEPYREKIKLRYRIDGILHNIDVPPTIRQLFPAIISRVKVLSNLSLVERRLPQDGRASVKIGEEKLDLRISILPSSRGESIVVRILPNQRMIGLKDLGFREEDLRMLEAIVRKPHGLVFVTGPTGSGKTTTLYACLNTINSDDRKIITIEDPVEYEMEGVTQVQVNPAIGLTFAQGLRSMLRHDPDVMMVGEVRDTETAELAIRIALTGHLVLSTIHTNDATSGISRLIDMGIDPYLITSSVECIVAQRLVRLLCPECKVAGASSLPGMEKAFQAKGCRACHRTGFRGRTAIYEFFLLSQQIKDLILQRSSADAIRKAAIELGMQPMREMGWEKVKAGLTTLDEVLRATQDEK